MWVEINSTSGPQITFRCHNKRATMISLMEISMFLCANLVNLPYRIVLTKTKIKASKFFYTINEAKNLSMLWQITTRRQLFWIWLKIRTHKRSNRRMKTKGMCRQIQSHETWTIQIVKRSVLTTSNFLKTIRPRQVIKTVDLTTKSRVLNR